MGGDYVTGQPVTSSSLNSSPVRTNFGALYAGDFQPLRVTAQGTPDMTVAVAGDNDRGYVLGNAPLDYAGGNSGNFTAPAGGGEKQIDIIHIDSAGTLSITSGTPTTGTPSPPTYPTDEMVLAEVYLRQGMTVIKDADDSTNGYIFKDRSPLLSIGSGVLLGTIVKYPEELAVPTGFLECDGSTVSQTTYANLYALYGTTFGSDGGGNFTLPNLSSEMLSLLAQTDGTALGNMTDDGGLAAGFDGTISQTRANGATKDNDTSATIGKDWGAGELYAIGKVIVYGSNDYGFAAANPTITLTLQGSTDNFSASNDDLGDISFTDTGDESGGRTIDTSDITDFTQYRYHRVEITGGGTVNRYCAEIVFYRSNKLMNIVKT